MRKLKIRLVYKEDWWYHYKGGARQHQYHKATANEDGNWEIDNKKFCLIDLKQVAKLLNDNRLQKIKLVDIAWKGKHNFPYLSGEKCSCCNGERYINCDIKYPPIIACNAQNPYNNKYRMIDGRHRIQKMLFGGLTENLFYVFNFVELRPYIVNSNNSQEKFLQ